VRAALLIASLLAGAPPAGWTPDVHAARAYAESRAGAVSFHVRTEAEHWGLHADRAVASASVVKAMLMVAYLNRPQVRRRALRPADRDLLAPMIRSSDNRAATRVRDIVGNGALRRLARRVPMTRFATHPLWGLSRITACDQSRMWLRFESFVPRRHRDTAMRLLRSIVPRQRWGVGEVALPAGWQLHFKGGWGSGTGLIDHQVALLRRGDERVAVAILTTGSPSHAYGKQTLRGVAERLLCNVAEGTAARRPDVAGRHDRRCLAGETLYSASGSGTAGWSSAPPSSTGFSSSPASPSRAPTVAGTGFSGLTTESSISRSSPSGAGSTITVPPATSSDLSTKSASGSSM